MNAHQNPNPKQQPVRTIRRTPVVVVSAAAMAMAMVSATGVHGLILPSALPLHHRHHHHSHAPGAVGSRSHVAPLGASQLDDDGELFALESTTTTANKPVVPATEAERKKLVDALFKGTSSSSSNSLADPDDELGFLDKPFFDPNAYDDDDDSFGGKVARFVKNDYELFEAIFVACFFLLLITITKDLLRAQMVASGVGAGSRIF